MTDSNNRAERLVLGFSLFLLVALVTLSFLPTGFRIGSFEARPVDFISDITRPGEASTENLATEEPGENLTTDSLVVRPRTVPDFLHYDGIINYQLDEPFSLPYFSKALADLQAGRRKKVRIAHIGDSFLEGDIITMDLRSLLQAHFGGKGVGFVPITSVIAGFRPTINHSFSGWDDQHFKNSDNKHELFLSGHRFVSATNATLTYSGAKDSLLRSFDEVYAIYNGKNTGGFAVNGRGFNPVGHQGITRQRIADSAQMVRLSIPAGQTWYGLSMESDHGIYVDNFNFRGIDGNEFRHIDQNWYSAINEAAPYDLIILQFGANLLWRPNSTNFKYYEGPMIEAVQKLKRGFPNADIMIVTTGDKAFRYGGEYSSAKGIPPLLNIQHTIADSTDVHLWNLFHAMGGEGSIIKWVNASPPLANKDYTHVNFKGGKQLAQLLYNAIMDAVEANHQDSLHGDMANGKQ